MYREPRWRDATGRYPTTGVHICNGDIITQLSSLNCLGTPTVARAAMASRGTGEPRTSAAASPVLR